LQLDESFQEQDSLLCPVEENAHCMFSSTICLVQITPNAVKSSNAPHKIYYFC